MRFESLPQSPRLELIAIPPPPRDPNVVPTEEEQEQEEIRYHVIPRASFPTPAPVDPQLMVDVYNTRTSEFAAAGFIDLSSSSESES